MKFLENLVDYLFRNFLLLPVLNVLLVCNVVLFLPLRISFVIIILQQSDRYGLLNLYFFFVIWLYQGSTLGIGIYSLVALHFRSQGSREQGFFYSIVGKSEKEKCCGAGCCKYYILLE